MAKCGSRTLLYVVTALQLISTAERQIFDFMGYMWIPIMANFFNIIFVILGIFGIYQYHTWYIIAYLVWTLAWVGWNAFLICFYLDIGDLDNKTMDLLSFGTGSYSWWWTQGFGCQPDFFGNDTFGSGSGNGLESGSSGPPTAPGHPPKPKVVTGCVLEYQYVEVTHSAIQLAFGVAGLVIAAFVAHFYITVVDKKRRLLKLKSKNPNMYSIEYSPQGGSTSINGGLNTLDSDLYAVAHEGVGGGGNGGGAGGHMTPRRVKRRSHTRSSARSASAVATSNKSSKTSTNHRGSTRSYGGRANSNKRNASGGGGGGSTNPVNRLIDDQHRHSRQLSGSGGGGGVVERNGMDSSTSNDETRNAAMIAAEKAYGQINPGFQSSRPNSLVYSVTEDNSVSQQPNGGGGARPKTSNIHSVTDYEVSRPPSALTSYSNFHPGARRNLVPTAGPQVGPGGLEHGSFQLQPKTLTQDSFMTQQQPPQMPQQSEDDDDLPPPPPPLSSSPTPGSSGNQAQAQAPPPVPLQRTAPARRSRNEYVNMPLNSNQQLSTAVNPQQHQAVNSSQPSGPVNGNTDMSSLISSSSPDSSIQTGPPPHHQQQQPPPLPPHKHQEVPNYVNTSEANAMQQLQHAPPPLLKRQQNYNNYQQQPSSFSSSAEPQSYNDTQTLRADDSRLISQQLKSSHFSHQQQPQSLSKQQLQPREITIDYSEQPTSSVNNHHRYQYINGGGNGGSSESAETSPVKPDPPGQNRTREPVGNRRTENRSSLRAKQRREMEEKTRQHQQQSTATSQPLHLQNGHSSSGHHPQQRANAVGGGGGGGGYGVQGQSQEDDYGFAAPGPISPPHAGNCKCYKCQRKLTAI